MLSSTPIAGAGSDAFPALIDLLPTAVVCVDSDARAVLVNSAWAGLVGRPRDSELGTGWLDCVLPDERAEVIEWVRCGVREERELARDLPVQTPIGPRLFRVSGRPHHDEFGALRVYVLAASDVTEEVARESRLVEAARHDSLTGLANRAEFLDQARRLVVESARGGHLAALLLLDLNDFKAVNDRFGHGCGDDVLRVLSHRLATAVEHCGVVARLGGDEFALVLTDMATETEAVEFAEQLLALTSRPMHVRSQRLRVSASIGVALGANVEVKDLLESADGALYDAKRSGRSRVVVASTRPQETDWSPTPGAPDHVRQLDTAHSTGSTFHAVHLYRDDDDLLPPLVGYISAGLFEDTVMVVATPEHRAALRARLDAGFLQAARAAGRYLELDAAETLRRIMRGGFPDPDLFQMVCGTMILREAAANRRIRAYGEMVALLWADGQAAAALRLEDLWNELQQKASFPLLCAYPLDQVSHASGAYRQICDRHTQLMRAG